MNFETRSVKRQLFICCNSRESDKADCSSKGANEIVAIIKQRLRDNDLWESFKVTKSGCLGPCSKGVSAILYPNNLLITELNLNDVDELYGLLTTQDS